MGAAAAEDEAAGVNIVEQMNSVFMEVSVVSSVTVIHPESAGIAEIVMDAGDEISGSIEVVKDWVPDVRVRDAGGEVAGSVKVAKELDCVVPEVVDGQVDVVVAEI
jgi:hypothetical protein